MRSDQLLYLRRDVQIEPLCDQWYAWSYLIPPATAARNITGRHLKIMDSYISAPQTHASAVKNPKMLRAKAYEVVYRECLGGHDFLTWHEALPEALVAVLNPAATQSSR